MDDVIKAMLKTTKPTIVDVAVDPAENCFPMVPSGAAHNEMILGPDDKKVEISSDGLTLV
ncbi:acetolactate synthase 3 catalytic subunit [compost metagenome]